MIADSDGNDADSDTLSDLLEAMAKGDVEQCYKLVKADYLTQVDTVLLNENEDSASE